jgi:hypothetical protein
LISEAVFLDGNLLEDSEPEGLARNPAGEIPNPRKTIQQTKVRGAASELQTIIKMDRPILARPDKPKAYWTARCWRNAGVRNQAVLRVMDLANAIKKLYNLMIFIQGKIVDRANLTQRKNFG